MSTELPDTLYVSVKDAAAVVGVHRQTIEKSVARGDFATKSIGGRTMILTSSLLPDPMAVWWRHVVSTADGTLTLTITHNPATVAVQVVGTMRGLPVEHTDRRRLIPADLADRRIVLDELAAILGNALDHIGLSDARFKALIRDCAENYPT